MEVPLLNFLATHKWTLLFYTGLIFFIYANRHRLEWQGRIVGLYRTKVGLRLMDRLAKPTKLEPAGRLLVTIAFPVFFVTFILFVLQIQGFISLPQQLVASLMYLCGGATVIYGIGLLTRPVKRAGQHAVWMGFAGMAIIFAIIILAVLNVILAPEEPPMFVPPIPGTTIPGTEVMIPLIVGWLALFLVIVVHEFSHGVVARAHGVRVKSSGLAIFGPFGGAFVEPDEKQLAKKPPGVRLAVFAAGPFSNIVSSALIFILIAVALSPAMASYYESEGVLITEVQDSYPAATAGISQGLVIVGVDGIRVSDAASFRNTLEGLRPGDLVGLEAADGSLYVVNATASPDDGSGYLGVYIDTNSVKRDLHGGETLLFWLLTFIFDLALWSFIFSLGLGLGNLMPAWMLDGGQMMLLTLTLWLGEEKGKRVWLALTKPLLFTLLILLLYAVIRWFV